MFRKIWRNLRLCNGQFHTIKLNSKLVKKLCTQLVKYNIVPSEWMHKPQIDVSVKAVNMQGPRIQANINQVSFSCLLDSGSTFSIMPYHLFKQLNISEFQLNRTTKYNINSASHRNEDAVLGTYIFNLNTKKSNKSVFICP